MSWKTAVLGVALSLSAALGATPVRAQVDAAGSTKLSLSGSGFIGSDFANLTNIVGLSRFTRSGLEIGGDVMLTVSRQSTVDPYTGESSGGDFTQSGFVFGRVAYNFIGESTLVPFVSVGVGREITDASTVPTLLDLGGGFKKFISERASFDVMASYEGSMANGDITWESGVNLFYGLSFYIGGHR